MATLGDLIEGMPNDVKQIIDKKMMMDLSTRAQSMRARTMPVPELHTAVPVKSSNQLQWPRINFKFEGEMYVIQDKTGVTYDEGLSMWRINPFTNIASFAASTFTLFVIEENLPLVQALLTVVRRFYPSATPQNITVFQYGQPITRMSLIEFMKKIKTKAIDGGEKCSKVKFEGRVYKLHSNKAKENYIIVSKEHIYLKDIRRRYRFSHKY